MSNVAPEILIDQILDVEVVEEEIKKMKESHVPYEHLEITCNKTEINGEAVEFLFDDKETGVASGSGTSKWLAPLQSNQNRPSRADRSDNSELAITITVKDQYSPIILTHYALKSANDAPDRDPKRWTLCRATDTGF